MKISLIFFLFKLYFSFNTSDVIEYARTWCDKMNPEFNIYGAEAVKEIGNFASQCLYAGGQSFSGCKGKDNKGMIPDIDYLIECLINKKGWKSSTSKISSFKPGYFVIRKGYTSPLIVTGINGNNITYCRHNDFKCDEIIDADDVVYYYL